MKDWIVRSGWIIAAAAIFWLVSSPGHLHSQAPSTVGRIDGNSALQLVSTPIAGGTQLVVLDQTARSLAVYQVDQAGNLALKCVRNLILDLRMEEFNGTPPLPSEFRRMKP